MRNFAIIALFSAAATAANAGGDYTKYVDVFIGTDGTGHTYPNAVVPHGMVQAGPDTGYSTWKYCAGYNYSDTRILSFSQTRLSGVGCPDGGDVGFIPFTDGAVKKDYSSSFRKETEKASPGSYEVVLDDARAKVEIAATEYVALYRITYLADGGGIFFDFQTGMVGDVKHRVRASDVKKTGTRQISGTQKVSAFTQRDISFVVEFDRDIPDIIDIKRPKEHKAPRWSLNFNLKKGDVLNVKIAVSTVDEDGARKNLATAEGVSFEGAREAAKASWNKILSKIDADADGAGKTLFYTAMYHAFISPNNIADVDGKYRGADGKAARASSLSKKYYANFSLWDTFRAVFSLTSIVDPEIIPDYVNSMLDHFDAAGILPMNQYWGKETYCMIGNHAISAIAGAILRGDKGFDYWRALNAMVVSSTKNHPKNDFDMLEKYGYYPFDLMKVESVSRTLENCYGDYSLAQAAKAMGKTETAEKFFRRAQYWRNVFDPSVGFMRGRDSSGKWRDPFDPFEFSHGESFGGDYTEGNAWQYTFHVQQDVPALIEAFGGNAKFCAALDRLFSAKDPRETGTFKVSADVTGLIGQYVHGNEPSHHIAYMYAEAGRADRTAELVREICSTLYLPKPDGICGNDDCGQMSAWYIFSALGFYPLNPNDLRYVLGAPQVKSAEIDLGGGKNFKIFARGLSKENKYVSRVDLNGKTLSEHYITQADILSGGILEFFMENK